MGAEGDTGSETTGTEECSGREEEESLMGIGIVLVFRNSLRAPSAVPAAATLGLRGEAGGAKGWGEFLPPVTSTLCLLTVSSSFLRAPKIPLSKLIRWPQSPLSISLSTSWPMCILKSLKEGELVMESLNEDPKELAWAGEEVLLLATLEPFASSTAIELVRKRERTREVMSVNSPNTK